MFPYPSIFSFCFYSIYLFNCPWRLQDLCLQVMFLFMVVDQEMVAIYCSPYWESFEDCLSLYFSSIIASILGYTFLGSESGSVLIWPNFLHEADGVCVLQMG